MADLTDDQKLYLVSNLACSQKPSEIITAFRSRYGIEIDRKQVGRYDPRRSYYAGGDKWRAIFDARRQEYLEDVSAIPIAHKGFRLRVLQRVMDAALEAGNWALVANLLKQAAKEMGGKYVSRRVFQISQMPSRASTPPTWEERTASQTQLVTQTMAQLKLGIGTPVS